jgi:hypothetical protein
VVLERTTRAPPHTRVHVEGTLHLTPHHLIFRPSAAAVITPASAADDEGGDISSARAATADGPESANDAQPIPQAEAAAKEVWVPYPTINLLQRLPQSPSGMYPLLVGTKTFDTYTLLFERDREGGAEDVWQSVKDCAVARKFTSGGGGKRALRPCKLVTIQRRRNVPSARRAVAVGHPVHCYCFIPATFSART